MTPDDPEERIAALRAEVYALRLARGRFISAQRPA